ncbi:MAG: TlyA family RNA methyltransferase [Pseudomonadota bacterium]
MRLDIMLVDAGFFESRARAQEAIKAGRVRVNGVTAQKPSAPVHPSDNIEAEDAHDFVSRGGCKLDAALRAMEVSPTGKTCLDLGASTGGFCDVLLRTGAAKIYAVDVGHGQLHPKILSDDRVVNLERTHARDLSRALIPEPIDIIVCDVSFISLKKALPPALALAAPGAQLVALVKPQFEVGRSRLGKGGVVKPGHANSYGVAEEISDWLAEQPHWTPTGYMESPIRGGDGNMEFLLGGVRAARGQP